MKAVYVTPVVEMLEFNYSDVVVASNHGDKGKGVSQTDKGCNRVPGHDGHNPGGK